MLGTGLVLVARRRMTSITRSADFTWLGLGMGALSYTIYGPLVKTRRVICI